MDGRKTIAAFVDFFAREQIPYVVIGGIAVQAWGYSRNTWDIDFAVRIVDRERVLNFAESLGFQTLYVSAGYSNHLHADPEFGRLDFMYVDETTAEKLFSRARMKQIANTATEVPVATPEHLIAMKVLVSELLDLDVPTSSDDVANLEQIRRFDRLAPELLPNLLRLFPEQPPGDDRNNTDSDEPFTL